VSRTVEVERRGRVVVARLSNPPRHFMTQGMVRELHGLLDSIEDDLSVGAVVITGAGEDVFLTHFDVEEIRGPGGLLRPVSFAQAKLATRAIAALARVRPVRAALERTPMAGVLSLLEIQGLFVRMNRLDKVFVAAINGVALGGACELALACDIRLMADRDDYRVGLPEVTLGIIPGAGGTQRMSRAIGSSRAIELILEGKALAPREARDLGLVHHVVAPERLLEEALAVAERLARRAPASVRGVKRAIYEGAPRALGAGLLVEEASFLEAVTAPAALRAMETYIEQVEAEGVPTPPELSARLDRWRAGTVVDMASQDGDELGTSAARPGRGEPPTPGPPPGTP
jgi:enoyl-CoA hydratase